MAPAPSLLLAALSLSLISLARGSGSESGGPLRLHTDAEAEIPRIDVALTPRHPRGVPGACLRSTFSPCVAGVCTEMADGSPSCACPKGTSRYLRADGRGAACRNTSFHCVATWTTLQGDTCQSVAAQHALDVGTLTLRNPGLNCAANKGRLEPGIQICAAVASPSAASPGHSHPQNCTSLGSVPPGSTCRSLSASAGATVGALLAANPGLQCQPTHLAQGQSYCVPPATFLRNPAGAPGTPPWVGRRAELFETPPPCFCTKTSQDFAPVCGANYKTYLGGCSAICGYAVPVASSGLCNKCQILCVRSPGRNVKSKVGCPNGYQCKMPKWDPQFQAVAAKLRPKAKYPLCEYFKQQCSSIAEAAVVGTAPARKSAVDAIDRNCFNCANMPCRGPSNVVPLASALCRAKGACKNTRTDAKGRKVADLNCAYWNKQGSPL